MVVVYVYFWAPHSRPRHPRNPCRSGPARMGARAPRLRRPAQQPRPPYAGVDPKWACEANPPTTQFGDSISGQSEGARTVLLEPRGARDWIAGSASGGYVRTFGGYVWRLRLGHPPPPPPPPPPPHPIGCTLTSPSSFSPTTAGPSRIWEVGRWRWRWEGGGRSGRGWSGGGGEEEWRKERRGRGSRLQEVFPRGTL